MSEAAGEEAEHALNAALGNATECGSGEGLVISRKNVAWMSLGAIGSAAKAVLAWKSIVATRNGSARIEPRGDGQPLKIQFG